MGEATSRIRRCTIQRRNGEFCDLPTMPGLSGTVCGHHAYRLFREMADIVDTEAQPGTVRRLVAMIDHLDTQDGPGVPRDAVVYYLMLDGLVKIGTTTDLDRRLRSYPPTATLLATEPGGVEVEKVRHQEFADYLVARREWFDPGPKLRAFIEALPSYTAA